MKRKLLVGVLSIFTVCLLASCGSSSGSSKIMVLGTTVISESGKTVQVTDKGSVNWKYNEDHTKIAYTVYGQTDDDDDDDNDDDADDTVSLGFIDESMKPQEITKLSEDYARNFMISQTGEYVYYTNDGKLYQYNVKKKESNKIAVVGSNSITSAVISYTGKTIAYVENGALKISVDGEKAKKATTDEVCGVYAVSDDGARCFYEEIDAALFYYTDGENNFIASTDGIYAVNRNVDEILFASIDYLSGDTMEWYTNYYSSKTESSEILDTGEIKNLFLNRIKEVEYDDIPLVESIGGLTYIKRNDSSEESVICRITDNCEDIEKIFSHEYISFRDDEVDYFEVYSRDYTENTLNLLYSAEGNKLCYIDDQTLYTLDLSKDDAEPVEVTDDAQYIFDANTNMSQISYNGDGGYFCISTGNKKKVETQTPAYCNQSENCFYYIGDDKDEYYLCTVDSKNKVNNLGLIIEDSYDEFDIAEKFITIIDVSYADLEDVNRVLFLNNNIYLQHKNRTITKTSLNDVKKLFNSSDEKEAESEKVAATEAVEATETVSSVEATESLSVSSDPVEPTESDEDTYAWQQDIDWREIYQNFYGGDLAQGYIFVDINNDGIPEIFNHAGSRADYMYYIAKDGEIHRVECMGYGEDGGLYYLDGYDEARYIHYVYDESTGTYAPDREYIENYTEEPCTYTINGEEVDEAAYNKAVESLRSENIIFPDTEHHWKPEEFEYDIEYFGTDNYDENYTYTGNEDVYVPSTEY